MALSQNGLSQNCYGYNNGSSSSSSSSSSRSKSNSSSSNSESKSTSNSSSVNAPATARARSWCTAREVRATDFAFERQWLRSPSRFRRAAMHEVEVEVCSSGLNSSSNLPIGINPENEDICDSRGTQGEFTRSLYRLTGAT